MIGLKKSVSSAVVGLLGLAACGGGSPGSGAPDQASSNLTLILSNAGVSPKASSVSVGSSITVLNSDSAPHRLASNPDSQQVDCGELNTPELLPGDAFIAIVADRSGTCAFIDSLNPSDSTFQGTISVTTSNLSPSDDGNGDGGGGG